MPTTPPRAVARKLATALALPLILLCLTASWAQEEVFRGQTSVLVVEIPMQVTRGGEAVRGLTAENFQILEGKKKVPIVSFEEIDLTLIQPQEFAIAPFSVAPAARRHFLMLFDLSFSNPSGIVRARQAANQLVGGQLHPSDLVAVATYSEAKGADLLLGFTSDRQQVEAALKTLGLYDPVERIRDPLKLMIADLQESLFADAPEGDLQGRAANDAILLENLRDISSISGRANRAAQTNQILSMSSSLEELAGYMGAVDGRKHVVFFSEGFDSSLIVGTEDAERLREMSQQLQFGQIWRVDTDERFGNSAGQQGVFQMLEQFRRSDCAIQAVDLSGMRAGGEIEPRASGQDGLFIMANQTGGELYRNYNDLDEAMGDLLERTSVTYLATIQPLEPGPAGEYHPLKIKLKNVPKGTRVTHRPGYYTPQPFSRLSPTERQLATASQLLSGNDGGSVFTSVLAAAIEGPSGDPQVLTLIEIDGPTLLLGDSSPQIPVEIFAYAIDYEGAVRDFFSQAIVLDLAKVGGQLNRRGFKLLATFELPPDEYRIRVLARNARTGSSGLRTTRVEVPDFATGESALLPPFFVEPQGTWLLGRARSRGRPAEYPLMDGGQPVIPAALPMVQVRRPTPLLLMGHRLGEGPWAASGKLTSADGAHTEEARIELTGRLPLDNAGLDRLTATFHPGAILPGEYRLDVTLTDESGRAVSSSIPIVTR